MKAEKIFWGLGFILLAVALILNALGIMAPFTSAIGEVSFIAIIAGLILLSYTINRIIKGKISEIFVPLSLIFMLFEKNIATLCSLEDENIINNWLLFGCACLLHLGFAIILPKRSPHKFRAVKCDGHKFHRSRSSLDSCVKYIDAESFFEEYVENSLGACSIKFANAEKYSGGGTLHVDNSLGAMSIEVPSSWSFVHDIDNSLGSVSADHDGGNPDGPILRIEGENSLGALSIEYV